jgi:hypothetical protein
VARKLPSIYISWMKLKFIAIIVTAVILVAGGYLYIRNAESNFIQAQVDPLYIYFHKLQDSIKIKHYPVNMDSLKKDVHDSMLNPRTFHKLEILADPVRAYQQK